MTRLTRSLLFSLMIAIVVMAGANSAWAEEAAKRIAVLPFHVGTDTDLSYLSTQIPETLSRQLERDGGKMVAADSLMGAVDEAGKVDTAALSNVAASAKVDHVVWGGLTQTGELFHLDVTLFDVKSGRSIPLSSEGKGVETLISTVGDLAVKIGSRIFSFETISAVKVEGNRRIEADAILRVVRAKADDRLKNDALTRDMKSIYRMGYFEDIKVVAEHHEDGTATVIFRVKEKPTIRNVLVKGNQIFDDEKVKKNITLSKGAIFNTGSLNTSIKQIESLYNEKHYYKTKVNYRLIDVENNQADLEFTLEEGKKIWIKEIVVEGNEFLSDKKIRKMIKTKQKGFFSWLTSSGTLEMADLNVDMAVINAEYQKNGFIDCRIADPEVEYKGKWIYITVKMDEGIRYSLGKVDVDGDILDTKEALLERLTVGTDGAGTYLDREKVQNDVVALTDIYSNEGYARASVVPDIRRNRAEGVADVIYRVSKGNLVYFDKIIITGNTVTRDKVIRRQLKIYEQELYRGGKLKESVRNLYRLEYFGDIKVNTLDTVDPDKVNLSIDVKEKPTGTFTFGMGYSSEDKLFGTTSISKRNLFGRDQSLDLKAQFGGTGNKYSLIFVEPWLFDIPLYSKYELKNWDDEYSSYDKETVGGGLTLGYPVFDYTRAFVSYTFERNTIDDIDLTASNSIKEMAGENTLSSMGFSLNYDSRDRRYNAQTTRGFDHTLRVEHTGGPLGGDISYSKYTAESSWFFPVFWKVVGMLHGEGGIVHENSDGFLPDYKKFYLGGINSMRGFEYQDIHLKDDQGLEIGGNKYVQFNAELIVPLFGVEGLVVLAFTDAGNVYEETANIDPSDLRQSYGFGFRWYSPIGPIRFERGYVVDPQDGEDNARWEFTMGTAF
ncbi:outer membrane protein assembly factor BamA [Desulfoluna sp.]|uniref:outer membrane protein assembly factor BamA n=1 Tax=Desulfoluna sp. TaxID=2045199 RepID=UPI00262356F7|nr:outer membrane protein assembly factor BamA [Desulfoluna sp.]